MKELRELKNDAIQLAETATRLRTLIEQQRARIADVESDKSRSKEWILEQVAEIKKQSQENIWAKWSELNERHAELKGFEPFFANPLLALSREPLLYASYKPMDEASKRDEWAANEAVVRANILQELALMPVSIKKLWAVYAADRRDWGRVYLAALSLGDALPFRLGSLPIASLETADEIFYLADVALRESEILMDELKGVRKGVNTIALGLMHQEHDRKKMERQAGWAYRLDEKDLLQLNTKGLPGLLEPVPLNITLPDRQTGAGFLPGAPVED